MTDTRDEQAFLASIRERPDDDTAEDANLSLARAVATSLRPTIS